MSARRLGFLTFCAALLSLSGCESVPRPIEESPGGNSAAACTGCHGDPVRAEAIPLLQAAPPAGPEGRSPGAHQAHLHDGTFRTALGCSDCHVVPESPAHSDGAADVDFGVLAASDDATPSWSSASGTCAVYCHGATLGGGPAASPAWDGSPTLGCSSCHGAPPPLPHPAGSGCAGCHPGTVDGSGAILVANGLHINGTVDVGEAHAPGWADPDVHGRAANEDLASCRGCHGADYAGGTSGVSCNACHGGTAWQTSCTFCHGTAGRGGGFDAAPPVGTQGETAATDRAVGAHLAHLAGGGVGPAVPCAECHAVPTSLTHVDGSVAVSLGGLSRRNSAAGTWDVGTLGCATYCHGATLGGGTDKSPAWTSTAALGCGSCHGAPPPAPHSASADCAACHSGYTSTMVNAATHLDGTVQAAGGHAAGFADRTQHGYQASRDGLAGCKACHGADLTGAGAAPSCNSCHGGTAWQTDCTFCHGTPGGLASPPVDTQGQSARALVSVGAHARHLSLTWMSAAAVTCATCHPARTASVVTDTTHVNGRPAEVAFTGVANQGSGNAFNRTSDTAANCTTYCHGRFTGGSNATPSWVSTTAMTCTSCHGLPPSTGQHQRGVHSGRSCGDCHPGYTRTAVNAASHVNGTKQVGNEITSWNPTTRQCSNTCHGSETW